MANPEPPWPTQVHSHVKLLSGSFGSNTVQYSLQVSQQGKSQTMPYCLDKEDISWKTAGQRKVHLRRPPGKRRQHWKTAQGREATSKGSQGREFNILKLNLNSIQNNCPVCTQHVRCSQSPTFFFFTISHQQGSKACLGLGYPLLEDVVFFLLLTQWFRVWMNFRGVFLSPLQSSPNCLERGT